MNTTTEQESTPMNTKSNEASLAAPKEAGDGWLEDHDDERVNNRGVDLFAEAMKAKLETKRLEGYTGWNNCCTVEHLAKLLLSHVPKGDPVDIANFAMMLFHRNGADAIRRLASPSKEAGGSGYKPIERDEDFDREYLPLPGGWEIQTKGKGSTFRICDPEGNRLPIPDSPYLHDTLMHMGRQVNAAWKAANPPGDQRQEGMQFSLGEAQSLVTFFGGNNTGVTVQELPERDVYGNGAEPLPAGKYAWCTEYPEEGCMYLGPHDPDTDEHNDSVAASPPPEAAAAVGECQHAWRPDADIEGAVYCGRCDCTRRIADGGNLAPREE